VGRIKQRNTRPNVNANIKLRDLPRTGGRCPTKRMLKRERPGENLDNGGGTHELGDKDSPLQKLDG